MLKRNKKLISKLSVLTICTSLVSNTVVLGDEINNTAQTTGSTVVNYNDTTTEKANPATDFNFDLATGTIIKYIGRSYDVVIPSVINGIPVRNIGVEAFSTQWITSVKIPEGIISIQDDAFSWCNDLTSITIPSSTQMLGSHVFEGASSLQNIIVSEDNNYYSSVDGVLFNKAKTEIIAYPISKEDQNYTIPDGVMAIGAYAFEYNRNLQEITISEGVTTIGEYAFYNSYNLTNIVISNSVVNIGKNAFEYCRSLLSVKIPGTIKDIPERAFHGCGLRSVEIESGVTSIGTDAFSSCVFLETIGIPDTVVSIAPNLFEACDYLKAINVDTNNESYSSVDGVLYNKSKTEIIKYPHGKDNLSYIIPSTVTAIDDNAFLVGDLESITIPASVTSIGIDAFIYCDRVTFYVESEAVKQLLINSGINQDMIVLNISTPPVKEKNITLSSTILNLVPGDTARLMATVAPIEEDCGVVWESSDTNVATVDGNGIVKSTGFGTATITCTSADGSGQPATCSISSEAYTKSSEIAVEIALQAYSDGGYEWRYITSQNDVIQEVSQINVNNTPPEIQGASGIDVWSFKGLKEGSTLLKFTCMRPWESTPIYTRMFIFTVDKELKVTVEEVTSFDLLGDVNGDKSINSIDYAVMKKHILGFSVFLVNENADMNKDGNINSLDFAVLKKKIING